MNTLHHPSPSTAEAKKPLYLATREALTLSVKDDALLVRIGTGCRRFPLTRIARIVCNQHADWSGAALSACLSHGITLTWLDGHGHAVGSAMPPAASPTPLHASLEAYLEDPAWLERYANWLRRRRMAVLCAAARQAKADGQAYSLLQFTELKREYVYRGQAPQHFPDVGLGSCHAVAAQALVAARLQSRYWGYGGNPLNLAEDLCRLLWAALNLACGDFPANASAHAQMLFFENWIKTGPDLTAGHLAQLARHVAQENELWP